MKIFIQNFATIIIEKFSDIVVKKPGKTFYKKTIYFTEILANTFVEILMIIVITNSAKIFIQSISETFDVRRVK